MKTLEMETVILFVKMGYNKLAILAPVLMKNLLIEMDNVFLRVKMVNGMEMMKLNAHADLVNLSTI